MKKILLLSFLVLSCSTFAQYQLQFTTVNQYGNNLYLDNVAVGTQFAVDAGVAAINNIKADTNYALGSAPFVVGPEVAICNFGKNNITSSFTVTMTATPGTYTSTKTISSLSSGQLTTVTFDNVTITPGTALNFAVTTNLTGDLNAANNTLNQYTLYLAGVKRTLLLEEWTSSTCPPCAANNPTVDAFIAARFDSLCAVKYHMNWPAPGDDPMYLYNPTQANDRRNYYGVNSVPHVIMDGLIHPSYPYSVVNSLPDAYSPRTTVGTPVSINVVNTRLPGDTIKADVTVNVVAPLMQGTYYLRVQAIERHIHYATAPGTNGETDFYDVFRKAFPTSLGTTISRTPGTYNFTFKYKLDLPAWVDTMMYTLAFVQNDATKEVLNSGKSRHWLDNSTPVITNVGPVTKPVPAPDYVSAAQPDEVFPGSASMSNIFQYELFETKFPAPGWSIKNPNAGSITFEQFTGANGNIFGGNKSVIMGFYSYSSTNQSDTLYSRIFSDLNEVDSIKFDYAYAMYSSTYLDRLIVKVSNNNGATFPFTIFDKSGAALATAPTTTNNFVPASSSEWATFCYPVAPFVVPVELTSFTGSSVSNGVLLNWTTGSETNNYGFEVQRKSGDQFISVGFVKGNGTTTEIKHYSYSEKALNSGTFAYRLKQVDLNGKADYSDIIEVVVAPHGYYLVQNYPNPFNPTTKISFSLAEDSKVAIMVYNTLGEEVVTLIEKDFAAGTHQIDFNAANLNSGVYFYKLLAVNGAGSKFTDIKKMTLIK